MHCTHCQKRITEQTARIYGGRCVPCHRRRPAKRLVQGLKDTVGAIGIMLSMPFWLLGLLALEIRDWFVPLPFTRREVLDLLEPICGRDAARMYFKGLRTGFLRGGRPAIFGPPPLY